MKKIIHKAIERGAGEYGWLKTRYSFSFADWYEPTRMGFGALRVINDDLIAPGAGFPTHSHRDMEIITIVTNGAVAHRDSMGNMGVVKDGDVQAMSAGEGVQHSEYNNSKTEELRLFQIWIESKEKGIKPVYAQKAFNLDQTVGNTLLISPTGERKSLAINQEASITYLALKSFERSVYNLKNPENGLYIFIIGGEYQIEGEVLASRDAIGLTGVENVILEANSEGEALLIEVPMG